MVHRSRVTVARVTVTRGVLLRHILIVSTVEVVDYLSSFFSFLSSPLSFTTPFATPLRFFDKGRKLIFFW